MTRAFALALAFVATPALAQHEHHHDMPMPAEPASSDPVASEPAPDPHAGHEPGVVDPPVAPPPPEAEAGPPYAADTLFGTPAMADARQQLQREHGGIVSSKLMIDRLEASFGKGRDGYAWDAEGWYGGDIDRLRITTEGEGRFDASPEHAEVQALWSHAIDPWFNLQAGVRQDLGDGPDRTHAVIGILGLAPYWIEGQAALFLSGKGDVTARLELEYDLRLTRQLILQPRTELNFAAQDIPESGIGSGLSTADIGLRLRYEFIPEFAPYIGLSYASSFGDTSDFRRAEQERTHGFAFLSGLRAWF